MILFRGASRAYVSRGIVSSVDLSQGVPSEAFESLVQGYDEAIEGVIAGVVSAEVLVRWVF